MPLTFPFTAYSTGFGLIALVILAARFFRKATGASAAAWTPQEIDQANSAIFLLRLNTRLEPALLAHLHGKAGNLLQSLCPSLRIAEGRQELALQAYEALDTDYRHQALPDMLSAWLQRGEASQALTFLQRHDIAMPGEPLLAIPLLTASGQKQALDELLQALEQNDSLEAYRRMVFTEELSEPLFRFGYVDLALRILDECWRTAIDRCQRIEFDTLAQQYARQGHIELLLEKLASLSGHALLAASEGLIKAGHAERLADEQLAGLSTVVKDSTIRLLLDHQQYERAERLCTMADAHRDSTRLRCEMLVWMAESGDLPGIDHYLQRQGLDERTHWYLLCNAWQRLQDTNSPFTERMAERLQEASRRICIVTDDDYLSVDLALTQLLLQAQTQPGRREPSTLLRLRDELETRIGAMAAIDWEFQCEALERLARVQFALGDEQRASKYLAQALDAFEYHLDDPELDDLDRAYSLRTLALAHLDLGQLDAALALSARSEQFDKNGLGLDGALLIGLLRDGRIEQSIRHLRFNHLVGENSPLDALLDAVDALRLQAPEEAERHMSQLISQLFDLLG